MIPRRYRKFVVACFAAAVATLSSAAAGASGIGIALVGVSTFGGALGVYKIPNAT